MWSAPNQWQSLLCPQYCQRNGDLARGPSLTSLSQGKTSNQNSCHLFVLGASASLSLFLKPCSVLAPQTQPLYSLAQPGDIRCLFPPVGLCSQNLTTLDLGDHSAYFTGQEMEAWREKCLVQGHPGKQMPLVGVIVAYILAGMTKPGSNCRGSTSCFP